MTVGLQVTDGTTTVDLNDGSYFEIIELDIGFGAISAQFVTGSVRLYINGTRTQIQTELAALQKLLQQAVDYQGTGEGGALYDSQDKIVYLNYRSVASEVYYRSPITKAILAFNSESFVILNFDCGGIEIVVDFERRNWWEGDEAQLQLSTYNQTATTNAVTVYNPDDPSGDYCDYADVAYAQIAGDLPAATRLEMENVYNNVNKLEMLWIGCNFTNPANATYILQAEDATGATPTAIYSASKGNYVRIALTSGAESDLLTWAFTSAELGYAAGRWFKAIVKFWNSSTIAMNAKYRLQLEYNGAVFWKSGLVALDTNVAIVFRDLVTFQLPPVLQGLTYMAGIDIVLRGYQTTGASINIDIDYLELLPVDQYRHLQEVGSGCAYMRRVNDDGIVPVIFEDNPLTGEKTPTWSGFSMPIMLQPGRNHRLHFLQHSTIGDLAEIGRTMNVKLFYRPRRLTI